MESPPCELFIVVLVCGYTIMIFIALVFDGDPGAMHGFRTFCVAEGQMVHENLFYSSVKVIFANNELCRYF